MLGRFGLTTRRARLISAALAAVVVFALGYGAGVLSPRFTAPGDGSPEAGFARDMSRHHEQAVYMSFLEYRRGSNEAVRYMAYDMAAVQQYQIGVMETWLAQWRLPQTTDRTPMVWMPDGKRTLQADGRMPGMASPEELKRLEAAAGRDADVLFCQLMLRHHLGAIHMVDAVLGRTDNAQVTDLATSMRNAQESEVEALRRLLKDMGADPA